MLGMFSPQIHPNWIIDLTIFPRYLWIPKSRRETLEPTCFLWDFCPAGTKEDFPALGSVALLKIGFLGGLPVYGATGRCYQWENWADVAFLGDISRSYVLCNHFLALLVMRGWWGSKISPSHPSSRSVPNVGRVDLWESQPLENSLCTVKFSIIRLLFKSSKAQERSINTWIFSYQNIKQERQLRGRSMSEGQILL